MKFIFEGFVISPYEYDKGFIWFKREDGEGMLIEKELLRDCLEKFFQENM